jgi:predicted metal-binding protein
MPWGNLAARRATYARLIAQGRCGQCAHKLPRAEKWKTCENCRADARQYNALWRKEKAAVERIDLSRVKVPSGPRCPICSLLEPHRCIKASALDRRAVDLG